MLRKLFIALYIGLLPILAASCGGSGGNSNPPPPTTETGILLDSPVGGVNYQTATQSGTTDGQGQYSYMAGETVTFSIGDIVFPSTLAASVVTPLDMIGKTDLTDTAVINILRLLQSLDVDGDPTNGIEISTAAHSAATGLTVDFASPTFDTVVGNLVANSGSVTTALIDEAVAVDHFISTLNAQPSDVASYLNYADNRQWNYTFLSGGIPGGIHEYTVYGVVNGQDVFVYGYDQNWDIFNGIKQYFLRDMSSGTIAIGTQENGIDSFFDPPIGGCNSLYEACNETGTHPVFGDYDYTSYTELATVTLTTGMTYNDCFKNTFTDNNSSCSHTDWVCRGTGKVKEVSIGPYDYCNYEYELESITTYTP